MNETQILWPQMTVGLLKTYRRLGSGLTAKL